MSRYQSAPSTPSEPSTAIDFDYASSSMSVVKQRRRTDCGIAAVATVGGFQYEVAKRAIFGDEPRTSLKTTPTDLRRGLAALGVIMGMLGRAVRGRWSDVRPMTGVAMVRVKSNGSLRSNHWVVFASEGSRHLVLDPADGTRMSCEGAARNGLLPVEWFDVGRADCTAEVAS